MRNVWPTTLLASLLVSCVGGEGGSGGEGRSAGGGGSRPLSAATALAFEGVYVIEDITDNESGCDAEGPSVLTDYNEQFLFAVTVATSGRRLELVSCLDVSDCQFKAETYPRGSGRGARLIFAFDSEQSREQVSGIRARTSLARDGVCEERDYTERVMTRMRESLRVESHTKLVPERPAVEGYCELSDPDIQRELEALPCISLHVLDATRVADLP